MSNSGSGAYGNLNIRKANENSSIKAPAMVDAIKGYNDNIWGTNSANKA